jgi:hypothetical protein
MCNELEGSVRSCSVDFATKVDGKGDGKGENREKNDNLRQTFVQTVGLADSQNMDRPECESPKAPFHNAPNDKRVS